MKKRVFFNNKLLGKKKIYGLLFILFSIFLSACASSGVSREAASNIDQGVEDTKSRIDNAASGSVADSYQNTSQQTKGMLIGGVTGAGVGSLTPALGIFPGLAIGAIFGGSYGAYIDAHTTLRDKLENRGANIIILGDQILIVLPSARIFDAFTAKIKPDAYSTLQLVADFVNKFTKMTVKISAYTNDMGPAEVDLALSQQQAESVARFLTADGMDARLIYAMGYGGTRLVQKNTTDWDGSENYRIEITLEKLYV